MNKYLSFSSLIILSLFFAAACLDPYNEDYEEYQQKMEEQRKQIYEQYQADSILILEYLNENDSLAIFDEESGIFYNILKPGEEPFPSRYSSIEVKYKGMLLDGTVFDQTENNETTRLLLNQLISGWQIGVPKIGMDGRIILYLPSFFGFGTTEHEEIPANSVLIFDIELISYY
jgi:FKBP-type peptidyl-prolyl cis-trans isomerase